MPELITIPKEKIEALQTRLHDLETEIADIKRSDQLLQKYQLLSENARDIILFVNRTTGRILEANRAAINAYGYDKDELLSITIYDLREKVTKSLVSAQMMRADEAGAFFETIHIRKDGSSFPVEVNSIGVDLNGESVLLSIIRGITERRRKDEEVMMLKHSIDVHNDGAYWMDSENKLVYVNNAACKALGYTRDELIGKPLNEISAMATAEKINEVWARLRKGSTFSFESIHRRKDGSTFPVEIAMTYVQFVGREYACGFARDITERKRVEEKLFDSRQMLQLVLDHIPQRIFWKNRNSVYLGCNKHLALDCGYADPNELIGKTDYETASAATADIYRADDRMVMETGLPKINYEEPQIKPDGTRGWLRTSKVPLRDQEGRVIGVLGMYEDITERKRAEEALRQSEERYRDLAESLPMAIFELDLQGRFTYVNTAALKSFMYTHEDVEAGLHVSQMIAPEDRQRAQANFFQRIGGGPQEYAEYMALRKDGSTFPITINSSAMLRDNRIIGLRGILTDLTERNLLVQEHLKSEKLESIGTLAGGIAHDFNNLLQGVFGYISLAKLSVDRRDRCIAALEQAEKALHQSVNLTSQLLTFSKGGKPVKKVINLKPVIEDAVKFALSGSRTVCSLSMADDLRYVDADAGQIGQVIQNLVLNADQAMALGGCINVSARNVSGDAVLNTPSGLQPELVEITVQDHGLGIPPEHLTKIFDPYFTTKEKGSGLGLATSYSIIRNHSGAITATSELGKGTIFTIHLPASSAAKEPVLSTETCHVQQHCRILVMDDDAVVRDVARSLLTELGLEVEIAEHGEAAIEKYRYAMEAGKLFDVIILDLTIRGGMGGIETLNILREIDPAVKAIVSSGYSEDSVVSSYRDKGFRAFLNKPYTVEGLRSVLSEVMG